MGFEYIRDLFGKVFKTSNKYKSMEQEAIGLIQRYYKGTITDGTFYTYMLEVQAQFYAANPDNVIDEGFPLWLNTFFGFPFHDWCQWYRLKVYHASHPEKFLPVTQAIQYRSLEEQHLDDRFRQYCRHYLQELDAFE